MCDASRNVMHMFFIIKVLVSCMCYFPRMNRLLICIVVLPLLVSIDSADAGVNIYPQYVFVSAPNRGSSIRLTNTSASAAEISIDFRYGYPVTDDTGGVFMKYFDSLTASIGEPVAVPWLRAFPSRFVLGSQESQVVRIFATPPPGQPAGEYWARVILTSTDKNSGQSKEDSRPRTTFKLVPSIDLPFHYRTGRVATGLSIIDGTATVENGVIKALTDLRRAGNASFWGVCAMRLIDQKGRTVARSDANLVVYNNIRFLSKLNVSTVPSGNYRLEVEFNSKRGDLRAEWQLKSEPVTKTYSVVIP